MARRAPVTVVESPELTHVDSAGRVRMVDVGDKPITAREAVARGRNHGERGRAAPGAERPGPQGQPARSRPARGHHGREAHQRIIPLCHPIALTHVGRGHCAYPRAGTASRRRARTTAQTGVEMEALTAVSAAALTIYDMLKAADREMVIGEICLVEKRGGRSGHYRRSR